MALVRTLWRWKFSKQQQTHIFQLSRSFPKRIFKAFTSLRDTKRNLSIERLFSWLTTQRQKKENLVNSFASFLEYGRLIYFYLSQFFPQRWWKWIKKKKIRHHFLVFAFKLKLRVFVLDFPWLFLDFSRLKPRFLCLSYRKEERKKRAVFQRWSEI